MDFLAVAMCTGKFLLVGADDGGSMVRWILRGNVKSLHIFLICVTRACLEKG
jgi:hypothetical protein